jgi:L-threonylcarbamoyladenylate synthase
LNAAIETRMLGASRDAVAEAARCLTAGGLVAFPTETVYGLGADATDGRAVARLYAAKGRPSFNPLIAHVPGVDAAHALGVFGDAAHRLARAFWPGPLTLVLTKQPGCPVADLATAGLDTIAVRVPDHPVAQELLVAAGRPIVAPSANRSGHVSPTSAAHVLTDLGGRIDLIVDGGPTRVGVESTIVACYGPRPALLRPGGVPRNAIEAVLGEALSEADTFDARAPLAPGMLESHYAPRARIRLNAREVQAGEALLSFGPRPLPGADRASRELNLSQSGDLIEAAANLFSHLRALDSADAGTIAAMAIPHDGLGEAINDRLSRAAAPRG